MTFIQKWKKFVLAVVDNFIWIILIVGFTMCSFLIPHFFGLENLINLVYAAVPLGLIVIAQSIVLTGGNFDLSLESILPFSVVIPALLMLSPSVQLNSIVGIVLTFLIGAGIGLLNGLCVTKLGLSAFLVTLCTQIIFRGLVVYLVPRTLWGLPSAFTFLGYQKIGGFPVAIIIFICIIIFLDIMISQIQFGRKLLCVGGNKIASFGAGINVDRVVINSFVLAGIISSLSGLIIVGRLGSVLNSMGQGMILLSFAGAIIGGVSLRGGVCPAVGIFGAILFLGIIENVLSLLRMSPYFVYALKGAILFIAIIFDSFRTRIKSRIL